MPQENEITSFQDWEGAVQRSLKLVEQSRQMLRETDKMARSSDGQSLQRVESEPRA
jgi:hypothetical protein